MEKLMPRENADVGHGNSDDMDFNDVFGGPPKRFSLQEVRSRYSFGETEEEACGGLKEKPVFGDEIRSRRRHNGGGDFFDDIFKVGDSSTSPRWSDRSNPGSRIMSPAPSNSDPFASSLPPHFSLPAKLSKTTEFPTFGSGSTTNGLNSSSPLSRFSNPAIRSQDERTNIEVQPLPRIILFSNEASFITEDPPSTLVSDQKDATHNLMKDAKSTADNIGNMFHFSIYKWAGKGIPMLTVPLVAANSIQSKVKNDRSSVVRKPSSPENLRSKEETKELPKAVYEFSKMESQTQSTPNYNAVSSESDVGEKIKKQETESLNSELDKQTKTAEGVHADVHGNKKVKGNEGIGIDSNKEKPEKSSIKGVAISASKGKVKEFVHIFNQEPDPILIPEFEKSWSCRWRNVGSDQNEASSNAKTAKEQVNSHDFVKKPDVSSKVDENLNKNEEQRHSNINPQKTFSSESIHTDSRVPAENADDPVEDNFLVQELTDDNENVKESCEETKAIDVKIRQWSVGKKGNIRSLLSTLQYVLWAESGWKPVPLMDLIEANSVKRAYQKALLRLHPDKLQQKGASFQHKYIAEKVFDILQEAWDHFNTSSVTM